ncbi:MAG: hypothetical protein H7Y30_13315 [Pyrinomonadaceae bacterium]|nr:hypothetical protein [Pyrinomonadaceae bacterium]
MKRCPTCNRTYADDAQKFCLDDGTTLTQETAAPFDPQATLAMTPGSQPTTPPSNPYGSGAGQSPYGSGAGQSQQPPSWTPTPTPPPFTPPPPAARKRSIWPWVLGGAAVLLIGFVGIIIAVVLLAGNSNNSNNANSNSNNSNNRANTNTNKNTNTRPPGTVITSTDSDSQITVPAGWTSTTGLNSKATLQASNKPKELYLIVLSYNKANYGSMTLDTHAEQTLDEIKNQVSGPTITGPTSMTINGRRAVQNEVRGISNNYNVVYLHTTVETPKAFQEIVVWTLASSYDDNKETLQDIINSFK